MTNCHALLCRYQMDQLKSSCGERLLEMVSCSNVCQITVLAASLHDDKLKKKVKRRMAALMTGIEHTEEFDMIMQEMPDYATAAADLSKGTVPFMYLLYAFLQSYQLCYGRKISCCMSIINTTSSIICSLFFTIMLFIIITIPHRKPHHSERILLLGGFTNGRSIPSFNPNCPTEAPTPIDWKKGRLISTRSAHVSGSYGNTIIIAGGLVYRYYSNYTEIWKGEANGQFQKGSPMNHKRAWAGGAVVG